MPRLRSALWAAAKVAAIAGTVALGSCTSVRTILKTAPTERPAAFRAQGPIAPLPKREALSLLERELYGPVVAPERYAVLSSDESEVEGGRLRSWIVELTYPGGTRDLLVAAVMPTGADDAPVLSTQNFCPTQDVLPFDSLPPKLPGGFDCSGGGFAGWAMTRIFGRHIVEPPLQDILDRGFGLVAVYPSEVVPDSARASSLALAELFPEGDRPGALALWAGLHDVVAELISDQLGERDVIAYGHSRYGKTALLAGAWFDSVDGVIAHQSGTLGSSNMRDRDGEPLDALVRAYPHWGRADLAARAKDPLSLPRPARLLQAIGDKPVLQGNARRDVWSDPTGAWTESFAAWGDDFGAPTPGTFDAVARKAFWLRPGTHGVVKEDWEAFLDWAEANFQE